jgi:hypothetical protein
MLSGVTGTLTESTSIHSSKAEIMSSFQTPLSRYVATFFPVLAAASPLAGCSDSDGDGGNNAAAPAPVFLSQSEARAAIGSRDEFVSAMSKFDLQSRTGSLQPATVDQYLSALPDHVIALSTADRESIAGELDTVLDRMTAAGLRVPADPPEVQLVRTDGKEEGDAVAYTRSDTIFLCDGFFASPPELQVHVIAHELFHIWSRANPEVIRWPTHEALGFARVPGTSFPASLADRKITNPDDPLVNETIRVTFQGVPTQVFLGLLANADYHGGALFDYLQLQLIEPTTGALHALDSAEGLVEQIGTTTPNVLSAEEISAEHFAIGLLQDAEIHDPALIQAVLKPFAAAATANHD